LTSAPQDKRTLLVQVAGQGACRNCMFSVKDRISLEHLGLSDRVGLRHFGASREGQGLFFGRFWASVVVSDILNQLAAFHRPAAPDAVDALYERCCDELEALAEHPEPGRARAAPISSSRREPRASSRRSACAEESTSPRARPRCSPATSTCASTSSPTTGWCGG
jgi:plasmid stabilization system protein ParE